MKTKTHQPNQVLPMGAKLLRNSIKRAVGGWSEMTYDAKLCRSGITWLRVKGGMGERGDREDWVADLPEVAISIHDYHWNGEEFGLNHGSFEGAIKAELKTGLQFAKIRITELEAKLKGLREAVERMELCADTK